MPQGESITERIRRISNAFYEQFQPINDWRYWIEEIFDTYLIAGDSEDSKFFQVNYTADDESITFSSREEWQELEKVWQPVSEGEERMLKEAVQEKRIAMRAALPSGDGHPSDPEEVVQKTRHYGYYKTNARASSDGKRTQFVIATDDVARDGAIVEVDGINVGPYMDNPVVLWDHGRDPRRGREPIARTVQLEKRESNGQKQLLAAVEWEDDDFAQGIKRKVENGGLNMASFAWLGQPSSRKEVEMNGETFSAPVFEESEMMEFSVVAIGSDRNALVLQRDIDALREELKRDILSEMTRDGAATAASAPSGSGDEAKAESSAPDVPDEPALNEEDYARIATRMIPKIITSMRGELKTLVRRQLGKE